MIDMTQNGSTDADSIHADIVLRGGTVIDGSGRDRFIADVLITAERISGIVSPGL